MSDFVLYRKYRPQKFKDVLGQEHIVQTLLSAIESDRVAHAYLFAGPRGTGKTSMARILARELGCTDKDLYEIDAASHTSVENVRDLCEGARTLPFESPKKVYIIDEVHMLSKSAFNAFLKTLEEPPSHTVFVLATTELKKVPDTILSRCQIFNLNKPSEDLLSKMILSVAKKEGFEIEKDAAYLLALLGDGSFRDAQVFLQQVLSASGKKNVSLEDVEKITGAPGTQVSHDLIRSLVSLDPKESFETLNKVVSKNTDMKIFTKMLLNDLRKILIAKHAPELLGQFNISDREQKFYKEIIGNKNSKIVSSLLREFLVAYNDIGKTHIASLPLELAISKIFETNQPQ